MGGGALNNWPPGSSAAPELGACLSLPHGESSMATPEEMAATMAKNLKAKTGKSLAQWVKIALSTKLAKHSDVVRFLKEEQGLGHGYANLIALELKHGGKPAASTDDMVAAQYAGAKEDLRPIYDSLVKAIQRFGKDVEVSPKKAYVSLRRSKQFALIQPSTKTRVDVGLNLKGEKAAGRLQAAGSMGMVTHKVSVTDKKEVDAELIALLKNAYEQA